MTVTRSSLFRFATFLPLLAAALSCSHEPATEAEAEQPITGKWTLTCPAPGFNGAILAPIAGTLPFVPLTSLAAVPSPAFDVNPTTGAKVVRADLTGYIADLPAAIRLGKALFWDIQAGSDNKVACATCHFQAGADVRVKNQLNPGANGAFDTGPGGTSYSTNYSLVAADFPFVDSTQGRNVDNAAGSQGVRAATFGGISGTGGEITTLTPVPVFGTMRQVTGVNAPSVVNAVYNHRNFFNGRAQAEFNGVNPWGTRDSSAVVRYVSDSLGTISPLAIQIKNASLASQAVGPPLNSVEMSAAGRTFPDLGRKMLRLKPLGLQRVDPTDSVLGAVADSAAGKGLTTTYAALIQQAFKPMWWNTANTVTIGTTSYSLMEANFSMFWGLAIMMYEGTLVSDQSPMDRYAASRVFDLTVGGNGNLLSSNPALLDQAVNRLAAQGITIPLAGGGSRAVTRQDILAGLDLFEKPIPPIGTVGTPPGFGLGCNFCHIGAETTSASIRNLTAGLEIGDVGFKTGGFDMRMERMFMGLRTAMPPPPQPPLAVPQGTTGIIYDSAVYTVTVTNINGATVTPQLMPIATYDVGWYNVGVRPTADNAGLGGTDLNGQPLSWTQYFQKTRANPSTIKVPGGGLVCVNSAGQPVTPPAAPVTSVFAGEALDPGSGFPVLSGGLTKTEANAVAGSFKTLPLRNVELSGPYFHTGGKATLRQVVELYDLGGDFQNATLSPVIRPLALTEDQANAVVAFLLSLTDERVMYQRAPFDHPELPVPAGEDASGADLVTTLPAVGAAGSAALPRFLDLNPFQP